MHPKIMIINMKHEDGNIMRLGFFSRKRIKQLTHIEKTINWVMLDEIWGKNLPKSVKTWSV